MVDLLDSTLSQDPARSMPIVVRLPLFVGRIDRQVSAHDWSALVALCLAPYLTAPYLDSAPCLARPWVVRHVHLFVDWVKHVYRCSVSNLELPWKQ